MVRPENRVDPAAFVTLTLHKKSQKGLIVISLFGRTALL